jgi:HlyD family secretion protein
MPDHKHQVLRLALVAALLALLGGCSSSQKESQPLVPVQVATVSQAPIEMVINAESVLFPLHEASITPKVSAPVRRFYVNRGSRVKAGQLLAVLENRDLAASAIENKGTLAQAEAAYATTTAAGLPEEMRKSELDAEAGKQAFEAEQKLYDSRENLYQQGALPRKDLDQARVSLAQAKSQYEVAQQHWKALQAIGRQQALKSAGGELQAAQGKYMGAQAQLSYSEIHSPISGFVTERPLYPGEMATAGIPLLVVMDTSGVIAKAHVPQQEAMLLKIGDHAELSVAGVQEKIPARLTVISPATDPNSTTIEIWAQAANPGGRLHPGTTAQLAVIAQKVEDALGVPSSALLKQEKGGVAVAIVGTDSRVHLQPVQVGIQNGDRVQIISGLNAGQQVVTSGAYGLPDNTPVKVENSPAPEKPASD